jgi:AhpD family alkylhydroperoxidase
MTLHPKEKELAAVGISVATGCRPCTDYHIDAVRKAGATEEEIRRAVADALHVRRNALNLMSGYAAAQLGASGHTDESGPVGETNRIKELVSVGAAFGVNCAISLERHLDAAESVGISRDDIATIVTLGAFIKGRAASHVERLCGMVEEDEQEPVKILA